MKNYKKKCSHCSFVNELSPNWFKNHLETKEYICPSCSHAVFLKVGEIRRKLYNDFAEATQIVGSIKTNQPSNQYQGYYLNVVFNENKKVFEVAKNIKIIHIFRGNILAFKSEIDEKTAILSIPDKFISKNHAVLCLHQTENQQYWSLKDCGSTNGTFCNDEKLNAEDEIILKQYDLILLGKAEIELIPLTI